MRLPSYQSAQPKLFAGGTSLTSHALGHVSSGFNVIVTSPVGIILARSLSCEHFAMYTIFLFCTLLSRLVSAIPKPSAAHPLIPHYLDAAFHPYKSHKPNSAVLLQRAHLQSAREITRLPLLEPAGNSWDPPMFTEFLDLDNAQVNCRKVKS